MFQTFRLEGSSRRAETFRRLGFIRRSRRRSSDMPATSPPNRSCSVRATSTTSIVATRSSSPDKVAVTPSQAGRWLISRSTAATLVSRGVASRGSQYGSRGECRPATGTTVSTRLSRTGMRPEETDFASIATNWLRRIAARKSCQRQTRRATQIPLVSSNRLSGWCGSPRLHARSNFCMGTPVKSAGRRSRFREAGMQRGCAHPAPW